MSHQKILILDFGSQVTQLIARRVREAHVYCEVHPCDVSSDWVRQYAADGNLKGIILSGSHASVYEVDDKAPDVVLLDPFMPRALIVIPSLVAGTTMLMWLGELISQRGLGNGMSMMIFVSGRPAEAAKIARAHPDLNLIIDHLTEHGSIEPARLYESPFTDFNPRGVEGLFSPPQVKELLTIVSAVHDNAA